MKPKTTNPAAEPSRHYGFALLMTLVLILIAAAALAAVVRQSLVQTIETQDATEALKRRWATLSLQETLLLNVPELLNALESPAASLPQVDPGSTARLTPKNISEGVQQDSLDNPAQEPSTENGAPPPSAIDPAELRRVFGLNDNDGTPQAEWRITCELAGLDYTLVFTDEQAKLNPLALATAPESARLRQAVEQLVEAHRPPDTQPLTVALRLPPAAVNQEDRDDPLALPTLPGLPLSAQNPPSLSPDEVAASDPVQAAAPPVLGEGYGALFANPHPRPLTGGPAPDIRGIAAVLTTWGDGRVHLRRAADDVIEAACDGLLSRNEIRDLITSRNENPDQSLDIMLDGLDQIDTESRALVAARLTDQSAAHGLWVIASGPTRSWYRFSVEQVVIQNPQNTPGATSETTHTLRHDYLW